MFYKAMFSQIRKIHYLLSCSLILSILAGCTLDPKVREQKFVARGDKDFQAGKYSEALISYGRALQIDTRSAEVHYKLAQTHLKMGSWPSAYQELSRTVELKPDDWKAQLDL